MKRKLLTVLAACVYTASTGWAESLPGAGKLSVQVVRVASTASSSSYEGVVEAERQSLVSAQVAGNVVVLSVKVGDRVVAGQVLLRIDSNAADQGALAGDAQVLAAQAQLTLATQELARQRQLHDKGFVAKAALERALAAQQAAQSQVKALQAQASAVHTQAGFFTVRAPYAGVVSQLNVELGDMAMPGRPLLTVYDPSELRVSASVPSAVATQPDNLTGALLEVPALGAAGRQLAPTRVQVLPTVDAQSLTQTVRLNTPKAAGLAPGQFARVWLKGGAPVSALALGGARVFIPVQAIVRRAEMTGVYVLSAAGKPLLRQVRLGRQEGDQVEVLSGLDEGDKLVLNPGMAARLTRAQ